VVEDLPAAPKGRAPNDKAFARAVVGFAVVPAASFAMAVVMAAFESDFAAQAGVAVVAVAAHF